MRFIITILLFLIFPNLVGAYYYRDRYYDGQATITPTNPPNIVFPVQGGATFSDDFGDPRSGGRVHEGNDLFASKMTPILAVEAGRIIYAPFDQPSYGYMLSIAGIDGYKYNYLHINNDTPGTDDGNGGPQYAYAPGIHEGIQVARGQHIAWIGDSGNAEGVSSHLHFEIRMPDNSAINPYPYLLAALEIYTYDVVAAKTASPTINSDKGLVVNPETLVFCVPGSLIRTPLVSSVYYCGSDGKRYVFPNLKTYNTWYQDFSNVQFISAEDMAKVPLGGNVTYRPGVKLVKIQTDPKIYAVDRNGTLRWVVSSAIAKQYYGVNWVKNIDDLSDAFFVNYKIGNPINR